MKALGLAIALALLALPSSAEELLRSGAHFQVHCHFNDEAAADQALATVEAVWPLGLELYGFRDDVRSELLQVHVYRTKEDYERAEQSLTQGKFRGNWAFSHINTRSSHVVLQPLISDEALAVVGLPLLTRNILAHEAAHLFSYVHLPDPDRIPEWLAEGAACLLAERTLNTLKLTPSSEDNPYFATRMWSVLELQKSKRLPDMQALLGDHLEELGVHEQYALNWLLLRFMAAGKYVPELQASFAEARRLGAGKEYSERLSKRLATLFSKSKQKQLEREFHAYLSGLSPRWQETNRSLGALGEHWFQAAFAFNALAWYSSPGGGDYRIEGQLTIFPGSEQQMNVLLGRGPSGFLQVAFQPGQGVTLLEFDSKSKTWKRHGFIKSDAFQVGEEFSFSIGVKQHRVSVRLNGSPCMQVDLPALALDGAWGLGALRHSSGLWKISAAPGLAAH